MTEIYRIVNLLNGQSYIGQTRMTLAARFRKHVKADTYLGSIIREVGEENFRIESLAVVPDSVRNDAELFYMDVYKSLYPNGYNLSKIPYGFKKNRRI